MYLNGNISDFASRLHQLPANTSDITSFVTEGNTYILSGVSIVPPALSGKWEKEARLHQWQFTSLPSSLITQLFGGGGGGGSFSGFTFFVDTASPAGGDGTTSAITGPNRAFSLLHDALATLTTSGTLTKPTRIFCAATSGLADTGVCRQPVWNFLNSSGTRLTITTTGANRHIGIYNTGIYRLETLNDYGIYNNLASNVTVDGLQFSVISTDGTLAACCRLSTANNTSPDPVDHRISNCIMRGVSGVGGSGHLGAMVNSDPTQVGNAPGGTCRVWNCIWYGALGYVPFDSDGSAWATSGLIYYNCTCAGNPVINFADNGTAFNCLSTNSQAGDFSTISGDYNASSDASAFGAHKRINQTFSFVDAANGNLNLQAGDGGAKGFGLTDPASGLFNTNIAGTVRTPPWNIGAW